MVTDEYFDIVHNSLESIKFLLPPQSKILFDCIVDEILLENMVNEDNETLREIRIMEKIAESAKGKNSGLYNECFLLAGLSEDDSSVYVLLKKELILPVRELHDIDPAERLKAVEQWLMEDTGLKEDLFCDSLAEEILPTGECVYIPNRVPPRYDSPTPGVKFVSVF